MSDNTNTSTNIGDDVPARSGKEKRAIRSKKRLAKFIEEKSSEADLQNNDVFFGVKNITLSPMSHMVPIKNTEALHSLVPATTIILPITTRGIGFVVRFLITNIIATKQNNPIDSHRLCSALYRIGLLSMDMKISQSTKYPMRHNGVQNFQNTTVTHEHAKALATLDVGFVPLNKIISAVGCFEAFGEQYLPRYANLAVLDEVQTFDPTQVTFSHLREFVVALANTATPQSVRQYFYDHSPFPSAMWATAHNRLCDASKEQAVEKNFPLLLNPDEIMPAEYGRNEVLDDIMIIEIATKIIARKHQRYVHVGRIDYNADGNPSQLVSNEVEDVRCSDLRGPTSYSGVPALNGSVERFWGSRCITDSEFYYGIMNLCGELPKPGCRSSCYTIRSIETAKFKSTIEFAPCLMERT